MFRISAGREKKGKGLLGVEGLRELWSKASAAEDRVLPGMSSIIRILRTRPLRLTVASACHGQLLAGGDEYGVTLPLHLSSSPGLA